VCNAKAYPGADIDSDHNLVVARLRVKLKVLKATVRKHWHLERMYHFGKFEVLSHMLAKWLSTP